MNDVLDKENEHSLVKIYHRISLLFICVLMAFASLACVIYFQGYKISQQELEISQLEKTVGELNLLKSQNVKLNKIISELEAQNRQIQKISPGVKISPGKTAYITFDDGPSENTQRILDVLKENGVRATFFIVGRDNEYYREIYKRMIDEGHIIAPHSYTHRYNEIYSSYQSFLDDQTKIMELILSTGEKNPYIMRIPGGSGTALAALYGGEGLMEKILSHYISLGFKYFDWNVDSRDSTVLCMPAQQIANNVISASQKLSTPIILMHDAPAKKTTPEALAIIIPELKAQGYSFDVLSVNVKTTVQKSVG